MITRVGIAYARDRPSYRLPSTASRIPAIKAHAHGILESRYVRRCEDYFVCYLSSHNGCNRGCKFCHLTATEQTSFVPAAIHDFVAQALRVFKHYRTERPAKYMHFSFMARGEVLANPHVLDRGQDLLLRLGQLAADAKLPAKFCISTIVPSTLKRSLVDIFGFVTPTIYYSLYSTDETWRRAWMPGAMPCEEALRVLSDYQRFSKKLTKIHYALIEGQNDHVECWADICEALDRHQLQCEFNLVRYNPASEMQGQEPASHVLVQCTEFFAARMKGRVKIVDRVGPDVAASCGMFVK